jgi:hypothetical protein
MDCLTIKGVTMINAKDELLQTLENLSLRNLCFKAKCAMITHNPLGAGTNTRKIAILKLDYSHEEWQEFLSQLDFEYDDGFGSQELFGYVWLNDGTWLARYEYDGSEEWELLCCPDIPVQLTRN